MKRNIVGALVILFVTIAFLLVIDDISKAKDLPDHANVHEASPHPSLVVLDVD